MKYLPILIVLAFLVGCSQPNPTTVSSDATLDQRGAASKCPVHNVDLLEGTVDAVHIEFEPEAGFEEARLKRFPYTGNPAVGINNPEIKKVLIRYCPECRKENVKYMEEIDQGAKTP